jgi:hypothetical protein
MKKLTIILVIAILIFLCLILTGCYSMRFESLPTPTGYINYIESMERIDYEKKQHKKFQKKHRKKILKQQNIIPYNYR